MVRIYALLKRKFWIFIYIAILISFLIILFNRKITLDFIFGFILGLFNFFNQVFLFQYIINKGKKFIKVFTFLFVVRYLAFSIILILYVEKYNANIFMVFFGIAVIYISILGNSIIDIIKKIS
ncbi:hypothetical protein [Caloramator australicus]|uniref:Uncharacterized protein n=1 Tax=Caloramator australicus RC3 TaxID=857293 RepID=G0V4H6_9CLOT|nr:hypothetical protein [Caloramator australicus]CCC58016.1 hypothetical protein CAAU_0367 [Caloramator australicus RC3]